MGRLETKVWLALATIYVVWGSTFMAITIAVRDLPPFLSMGLRHLLAGVLLLAWALPRGDRVGDRIGMRQIGAAAIFGGALFLAGHGGLAWAQQTVPSGSLPCSRGAFRSGSRCSTGSFSGSGCTVWRESGS